MLLIADTSLLINFLNVDRMHLIGRHDPRCMITEHVLREVNEALPTDEDRRKKQELQQERLAAALLAGHVQSIAVSEDAELEMFVKLQAAGRLGEGECSAIAVALNRGYLLGIDDRKATIEAKAQADAQGAVLPILSTSDVIVRLIKAGQLSVAQADVLLVEWRSQHKFTLKIGSFAEIVT